MAFSYRSLPLTPIGYVLFQPTHLIPWGDERSKQTTGSAARHSTLAPSQKQQEQDQRKELHSLQQQQQHGQDWDHEGTSPYQDDSTGANGQVKGDGDAPLPGNATASVGVEGPDVLLEEQDEVVALLVQVNERHEKQLAFERVLQERDGFWRKRRVTLGTSSSDSIDVIVDASLWRSVSDKVAYNSEKSPSPHEKEYLEILDSVKGTPSEKRLASQFIARFFKSFPHLAEKAIDAQLDLCEDADVAIRKQAIKDLPSFCKDSKEYVAKIADVLAQLLLTEDNTELLVIHHSLVTLVKLDTKGTLGGVFSQIVAGEDLVRERAIKFLCAKLPLLSAEVLTKELEVYLFQECCKVMQDVTGQEFSSLMTLLSGLRLAKTIPGQQALVDLAAEQADLGKKATPGATAQDPSTQAETLAKLVQCIRQALPFFSPYVSSAKFVGHLCQQVVPGLGQLPSEEEALELLKLLAEMAPFASGLEEQDACLELVFLKLLEFMPLPPAGEDTENAGEQPALQLSHVECLMYTFHQLAKRSPEFLTGESSAERLRDFKLRLQYLARGVQGYIKKLRTALQGKRPTELKTDENKLKVAALKTTSNINILIRDLFHVPPSFKAAISLSWKPSTSAERPAMPTPEVALATPAAAGSAAARSEKRRIEFPEGALTPAKSAKKPVVSGKNERELYSPPGGKYSTKVQSFQGVPTNARGGVAGRGGSTRFRGFNRGWRGRIYS
ncbi:unnamed protein product [Ixodes persulcatus]